jgi:hypothetical protein
MWKRAGYVLVAIVSLFLGAFALLVIFDWLSGDTFINSVRKGWFGFIFARLVALFLVVLALRRLWRWSPLFGGLISGLGILFLGGFFAVKSYSPDGVYGFVGEIEPSNDSPWSPELFHKDHFWRISGAKVQDCYGDICGPFAQYKKTPDGWVIVAEDGRDFWSKLQFSVFGFRLVSNNRLKTEFYPRRIIPFARPYWMPQWMQ